MCIHAHAAPRRACGVAASSSRAGHRPPWASRTRRAAWPARVRARVRVRVRVRIRVRVRLRVRARVRVRVESLGLMRRGGVACELLEDESS